MKQMFFTFARGMVSSVSEQRVGNDQVCLQVPEDARLDEEGKLRLSSGALVYISESTGSGSAPVYWMSVFALNPATGGLPPPIRLEPLAA